MAGDPMLMRGHKRKKARTKRESLHAGFTYGYQWSEYRPPPTLRFPLTGASRDERNIRVYPMMPPDFSKTNPIELAIEQLEGGYPRWHHLFLGGHERLHPNDDTTERLNIALDWHAEHGYSVQPFVVAPANWADDLLMEPVNDFEKGVPPSNWMTRLVHRWVDYDTSKAVPETLWWLDTEIRNEGQWNELLAAQGYNTITYEVRNLDIWGNARDGYEQNNSFRVGTITIREDAPDEGVFQALVDSDFLRADALEDIMLEDNGDGFMEVIGPEVETPAPVFNWSEFLVNEPPELLNVQGLWEFVWELTLENRWGDGFHQDDPPDEDEIQGWLRDHNRLTPPEIDVVFDYAAQVAQVATTAAADAHRNSESRIPVLQLQRIDDED